MADKWTSADVEYLRKVITLAPIESAAFVLGRTAEACRAKAASLGLKPQPKKLTKKNTIRRFSWQEDEYIEANPDLSGRELAQKLNRSECSVCNRRAKLMKGKHVNGRALPNSVLSEKEAIFFVNSMKNGGELRDCIEKALDYSCTAIEREYVREAYEYGMTNNEIARRHDVDKSTVSRTIYRAFRKVKPYIAVMVTVFETALKEKKNYEP